MPPAFNVAYQINLQPFGLIQVQDYLRETLHLPENKLILLAQTLLNRTAGNPLFVAQLLMQALAKRIVSYDFRDGEWNIDVEQLVNITVASDVVRFLVDSLEQLPPEVTKVLRIAACLGSTFSVHTLEQVLERFGDGIDGLYIAENEGLVQQSEPAGGSAVFRFSHDRIMQASHSNNTPEQLEQIHLGLILI